LPKKLQSQTVSRVKLCKTVLYKKAACKMLVKLTPGWHLLLQIPCAGVFAYCTDGMLKLTLGWGEMLRRFTPQ